MEKKKAVVPATAMKDAEKHLKRAQDYYEQMQKNWYMFAKEVRDIRDKHYHDVFGVESFQKLCEREFPLTSFSTISKFIQIVEKLGDQIDKRLGTADYRLPTYETCYQLTSAQDKLKDEDFSKLRKQILDEKITVRALRDKLTSLMTAVKKDLRTKVDSDTESFMENTQKALDKELREDRSWEEEQPQDDEDYEPDDQDLEEVEVEAKDVSASSIEGLASRVDYLIDNIPDFVEQVEKIDGPTKALLKKMKKLVNTIDDAVDQLEGE